MKLNEILMELSFPAVPFKFTRQEEDRFDAAFEVGGMNFTVTGKFAKEENWLGSYFPDRWALSFAYDDPDDGESYQMTGQGNQYQILGTVAAVFKSFFQRHQTNCVVMTAVTDGRKKVYARLLKMMAPGWRVDIDGDTVEAVAPQFAQELQKRRDEARANDPGWEADE